ncbi:DNA-directed RNA polymerase subunit beta [Paenibacillus arenilitoris]|uniref:DNA-directed RNA polymerase subunit beta n=1 Tax=Paenibacillus arenilitoris TaxID=2772299 RepID=A0A927H5C2_9BACL|nr:DNA-directed RNA polymerase subunit beta [Paenibacillus arenilitoris]MBD2868383.1 DNA-directed RNA polymerase subunit beta [Paenibacillus arenilitoris]
MSMADERIDRQPGEVVSQAEDGVAVRQKRAGRAKAEGAPNKKQRPDGVKMLLWILRKSIVPLIMLIMLIAGLYIGYVIFGNGPKTDVFSWSTWKHLYDLVFAES